MKHRWFAQMVMLFQPESSGSSQPVGCLFGKTTDSNSRQLTISLKSLVWTAVSILCALAIGQLH